MTKIGICKISQSGQILAKNAYAREMCEGRTGERCKLHEEYLSQKRFGLNEFVLPEVIYLSKEHMAAVAMKTEDGFQVYFRSIENESAFNEVFPKDLPVPLTKAERQVLEKIFFKMTNQEIAETLFVSCATVKTHVAHLYQKLPRLKDWRNHNSPAE